MLFRELRVNSFLSVGLWLRWIEQAPPEVSGTM